MLSKILRKSLKYIGLTAWFVVVAILYSTSVHETSDLTVNSDLVLNSEAKDTEDTQYMNIDTDDDNKLDLDSTESIDTESSNTEQNTEDETNNIEQDIKEESTDSITEDTAKSEEPIEPAKPAYNITDIEDKTMYATCNLNIRSGPGTEYSVVGYVSLGDDILVTGDVDNGWKQISFNNNTCFCSGYYISSSKPVIETVVETVDNGSNSSDPYYNVVTGEAGTAAITAEANNYWNNVVPYWLKQKIIDNGWSIKVSAQRLHNKYGYSGLIAGMADTSNKTLWIDNRQGCVKRALLHELGHAIDSLHNWPSGTQSFGMVFNAEMYNFTDATSIGDGHEYSNAHEYFASVFHNIILDEERIKQQVPETYAFLIQYMRYYK